MVNLFLVIQRDQQTAPRPKKPRLIVSVRELARERWGVPGDLEPLCNAAPDQLSQNTIEDNLICILQGTTKGAKLRSRAIPFANLVGRWQTPSNSLPEKNLNFWGDPGTDSLILHQKIVHDILIPLYYVISCLKERWMYACNISVRINEMLSPSKGTKDWKKSKWLVSQVIELSTSFVAHKAPQQSW